jgi:hypothetical protein
MTFRYRTDGLWVLLGFFAVPVLFIATIEMKRRGLLEGAPIALGAIGLWLVIGLVFKCSGASIVVDDSGISRVVFGRTTKSLAW